MSDTIRSNSPNVDKHLTLRSSSVPSSCLRINRDGDCRSASIVRNVSFPADENSIVSGFLEPANPWEHAANVTTETLMNEYVSSCIKHGVSALPAVLEQIKKINFGPDRNDILDLKGSYLTVAHCEALEEIFKRVQFVVLNVESTCLDDEAATSLFDMIEYYESATHLVMSDNHLIDSRGWQACSRMIKKMRCLEILEARSVSLNDQLMPLLTRSLRVGSQLQVLKLENCHLTGRPFLILVSALKLNTNLKELFLGENYLDVNDAAQVGSLLKSNNTLQFLDLSNNIILDAGLGHIAEGLSEQTGPGLNMLVLWNNHLTYGAAKCISLIIAKSSSLEMLNIGQNLLTNDVIYNMKEALQHNHILLKLGMQSTSLTCEGAIAMAEIIADNNTLQRVDLRDNNFQIPGLMALSLSMKENMTITQLDLDETPRRYSSDSDYMEYKKLINEIEGYCSKNKESGIKFLSNQEHVLEETVLDWKKNEPYDCYPRLKSSNIESRKISLTCETLMRYSVITQPEASKSLTIEPTKTSGKLRSPLPSPVPSPVASPSPTRSRFHVYKVELSDSLTSSDSNTSSSLSPSSVFSSSRFKVTAIEPEKSPVVIAVPSKTTTTVGFECTPATLKKDDYQKVKAHVPFKLNRPVDSLDISPLKLMKQPAVEKSPAASVRTRKIPWVAPSSMFSFSQMQAAINDQSKQSSSLNRLIGLFTGPFSQFQNKQQSTSAEPVPESDNQNPPSIETENVESKRIESVQRCKEGESQSPASCFNKNLSRNELLYSEKDDEITVTISENTSQSDRGTTCVIGLSDTCVTENTNSVDFSSNSTSFCNIKPAISVSKCTDDTSCSVTSDEKCSSNEVSCRDFSSSSDESAVETDVSIVDTVESNVNSNDCNNKETVDISVSSLSREPKDVKPSSEVITEEIIGTNSSKSIIESSQEVYKPVTSGNNDKLGANTGAFFEIEGGCGLMEVGGKGGFIKNSAFDVDSSFIPRDSEPSEESFQLSGFSEKSVHPSDCGRLYLPCKLATWPQGLGLHLLDQTQCHMDDKFRCSSAPCLVEAATVVLFQRQLSSGLAVKIDKLSPTKCSDTLEPSTNLQMAS